MDSLQFTKIGETVPEAMKWIFLGLSVVAAATSLIPKYRKGGRFIALGCALIPFSQLPFTYLPFLAIGLRLVYMRVVRRNLPCADLAIGLFGMAVLGGVSIYAGTGKEIFTNGDQLSCTQRRFGSNSTSVARLMITEKTDFGGQPCEWQFSRVPSKTAEDGFVANVVDGELYWDHQGHVLGAREVALKLQAWSHVKPVEGSYGDVLAQR